MQRGSLSIYIASILSHFFISMNVINLVLLNIYKGLIHSFFTNQHIHIKGSQRQTLTEKKKSKLKAVLRCDPTSIAVVVILEWFSWLTDAGENVQLLVQWPECIVTWEKVHSGQCLLGGSNSFMFKPHAKPPTHTTLAFPFSLCIGPYRQEQNGDEQ